MTPNPTSRVAIALEKCLERFTTLSGVNVIGPPWDPAHCDRRGHVVILQGGCLAFAERTQQCNERAERFADLPKPFTSNFNDGVRKGSLAEPIE
jgi:hypothetical protein